MSDPFMTKSQEVKGPTNQDEVLVPVVAARCDPPNGIAP